jgi:hypothetical protein
MLIGMIARGSAVIVALVVLAGCAALSQRIDQRVMLGPTAKQMWTARVASESGRTPSFEETARWEDQLDVRISRYLAEHPEVANASDVSLFRFERQIGVGMNKEQIQILLGPPIRVTSDTAEMEKLARRFWPLIKPEAKEAWEYPLGWRVFVDAERVIDITQFLATTR